MMTDILVAGDLICDNNIVHYPAVPSAHHQLPSKTMQCKRPGGASYLKDVISLACSEFKDVTILNSSSPLCESTLSPCKGCSGKTEEADTSIADNVYQIWSLQDKEISSKEKTWRISELLGCEKPAEAKVLKLGNPPNNPYLLVLDDLGMGSFKDLTALNDLLAKHVPNYIVLKLSSLLAAEAWLEFLKIYKDKVTIILSADALRERGAAISMGLSWDRTIEETVEEFKSGLSSWDLAHFRRIIVQFGCEGVASFSREVIRFNGNENKPSFEMIPTAQMEHFLYHPREHEGAFKARRPGKIFGAATILTASVVRHLIRSKEYPIFVALGRAMAAVRINHDLGGGKEDFNPDYAHPSIRQIFLTAIDAKEKPEDTFACAFNRDLFSGKSGASHGSNLLQDIIGTGLEYVAAKAQEVIYDGVSKALRYAPMACYGDYFTVDREEIERINSVRNLIIQYQKNAKETRPLSIAVFGPPGSGKSFSIKQLAQELFGKEKKPLEFNLSQFGGNVSALHDAFHIVRDASIKGQIPLVFWDEFDSDNLRWLKEFLAPMQDAEFRSGSLIHPFGKAIFVFAGGTKDTFESFNCVDDNSFKSLKGPDFISRLRGFVNVKGPNPIEKLHPGEQSGEIKPEELAKRDSAFLIRRAMLLRSTVERQRTHLIGPDKKVAIGSDVVRGFLRAEKFRHGARSLESIVSMSELSDVTRFGGASLPNSDLLRLHVTDDFHEHVREGQLDALIKETLAEACHEAWRKIKTQKGWKFGPITDSAKKEHERLIDYSKLTEQGKNDNRLTARLTEAKLREIGYAVKRANADGVANRKIACFSPEERVQLMIIEHDIWLRDHLLKGYGWAENSNDNLKLHIDVAPFKNMPESEKEFDGAIVDSIIPTLKAKGYVLVEVK
jgi:hypothetical protein